MYMSLNALAHLSASAHSYMLGELLFFTIRFLEDSNAGSVSELQAALILLIDRE